MNEMTEISKEISFETIITNAIQIPGVKVDRIKFLKSAFLNDAVNMDSVIDIGPIEAGIPREILSRIANKLILDRTGKSSLMSFAAGIPGGFAMAATIPADVMQFFGMSLRLAQELSYLYGASDLWQSGEVDDEKVRNQLILYCGVMFGASGAAAGVRVLSAKMAKTTLKKLPQKALTKTFWYPLIKQIGKAIGVKVTKSTVAHGISKVIPVIGGAISGGLNFASMLPMARRLQVTLDEACFDYSEENLDEDLYSIENIKVKFSKKVTSDSRKIENIKSKMSNGVKNMGSKFSDLVPKKKKSCKNDSAVNEATEDVFEKIEKLAKLKELGAITQAEFDAKKAELLSKI